MNSISRLLDLHDLLYMCHIVVYQTDSCLAILSMHQRHFLFLVGIFHSSQVLHLPHTNGWRTVRNLNSTFHLPNLPNLWCKYHIADDLFRNSQPSTFYTCLERLAHQFSFSVDILRCNQWMNDPHTNHLRNLHSKRNEHHSELFCSYMYMSHMYIDLIDKLRAQHL